MDATKPGLVLLFTGAGKGKTTAALGLACRAAGHGLRVVIRQFIKGAWQPGEKAFFAAGTPRIDLQSLGNGFVRPDRLRPEEKAQEQERAEMTLATVWQEILADPPDMAILDEALYLVQFGLIGEDALLALCAQRPSPMHLVLTGRGATERLMQAADLVTEMVSHKHPYDAGGKARRGLEF